ncbi:MAG: hypothetical protein NZM10_00605 [Fimbriimonadales bacterium]|nr:hypothetical protein [Fimbriimonadales bacterium]
MKTLTIQVPDEVYAACELIAQRTGRTVEECVLEFLTRYCPRPAQGEAERPQALERLMRHFGVQSLGKPTGVENETLDADLQ